MLSVIMLYVVKLSVVMLYVIMLSAVMLYAVLLSVVMLNVAKALCGECHYAACRYAELSWRRFYNIKSAFSFDDNLHRCCAI
jgi:hypothetical protein